MTALISALLAALPNVLIAILSKFVTESFLQSVLEKVIIAALRRAAKLTVNTVDDELVVEIEKRLAEKPEST